MTPSSPDYPNRPEQPEPPHQQDPGSPSSPLARPSVNAWEGEYLDALYQQWADDPESVEPHWQQFFAGFELGLRPTATDRAPRAALPAPGAPPSTTALPAVEHLQSKVDELIYEYRDIG